MRHLEMLLTERYSQDGDIQQYTEEDMGEPYPYTTHKEPDYIHHRAQTTGLTLLGLDLRAEGPQTEHT